MKGNKTNLEEKVEGPGQSEGKRNHSEENIKAPEQSKVQQKKPRSKN